MGTVPRGQVLMFFLGSVRNAPDALQLFVRALKQAGNLTGPDPRLLGILERLTKTPPSDADLRGAARLFGTLPVRVRRSIYESSLRLADEAWRRSGRRQPGPLLRKHPSILP